jgi:hypothetical protein
MASQFLTGGMVSVINIIIYALVTVGVIGITRCIHQSSLSLMPTGIGRLRGRFVFGKKRHIRQGGRQDMVAMRV